MVVFSIIGALIGAGFASGQEIYLFFYRYGALGILGLVICSFLIGIVIYKTFLIIFKNEKIQNYKDFLNVIFFSEKKGSKNKYFNFSYISNIIVNTFLLITFYIMLSGFGAYFEQEFNLNRMIGSSILAGISFIILLKDIEGVTKVNSIIVPILIIIILIISANNIGEIDFEKINTTSNVNWLFQSIVYCSYNMILVIPVLVGLKKYIKSKKQISIISFSCGSIVFVLAINIFLLLTRVDAEAGILQMPAVYAINHYFPKYKEIYGIVILLSIFSTAISIGISFLKNVVKDKKSYPQFVGIMCISGVAISNFGFSNLVKFLFPTFGILGITQIYYILKNKQK